MSCHCCCRLVVRVSIKPSTCQCRCCAQLQAPLKNEAYGKDDFLKAFKSLRWAERIVVTGEALTQRLLGRHQLVQRLVESCIDESHTRRPDLSLAEG